MKKENLPGYEQLNLYDNLIEYKGSFLNCVLLNDRFPNQTALTWRDWTDCKKSNRAYLTYVFLNDKRHYRAMLKIWYNENVSRLKFPLFVFCFRESVDGNRFAFRADFLNSKDTLWSCKKYSKQDFTRLCGFHSCDQ